MLKNPETKYRPFVTPVDLPDRQWPSRRLRSAPRWLSTDLRDGNQSLANPMGVERKQRFYDMLIAIGFKEIEVAFPSASQTEFDFVRSLINDDRIPNDVTIQVLTQSRTELIARTFESLEGAQRAIVHLYNATAPLFRRVVFGMERRDVVDLAITGVTAMLDESLKRPGTDWTFEYSPETFCFTEPDFALEICERVLDVWQPTPERPAILNLPATVEVAMPNVYADQIEWFCRNISRRDSVVISLHPHNDRGTGVAAAELGLLAGADRVEGCLFGNGERTGNVDLVTLALNLYTQGIDPGLSFPAMREVVNTVEHCTELPVHPRHPYAGEMVHAAFSGSHQDAIRKGFAAYAQRNDGLWEMPYLPIDPADIGETYEAVIRVNSQSGKGGVAWVLEQDKGLKLPKRMQADFSTHVQKLADDLGRELNTSDIWQCFAGCYLQRPTDRFVLVDYKETGPVGQRTFIGRIAIDGEVRSLSGRGNGLISGVVAALQDAGGPALDVADYQEHAIGSGATAQAAAYVECRTSDGRTVFGTGIDPDVATASVRALLHAANNA
ncbi:2-isopropylmalate synthase [Rhodopseudomonas palustris]|uniref:2-isopropylmalate synthase n=1 Tax=Rhodopseudomonas palustris (strain ATCC BAA-98 / CGA009) TaxID=258594 RepID=Q6N0U6_RHOPA|nr:2-isopropylmalate synthase [Rhodopseudomonas palustris]OPF95537.1 2-isopropylmalate synthase [Rhodopseudomonas palustris]QQM06241.1 2-isopropylmalate synthase [Rhodopseudomonas palustris]RJF67346.1 2-isopropylmalate synthase [Rhodopseudomonas palustris]WAB77557.1 2-isopropylmalate synthase [Rhodopseudomonas palustris]WCL94870.1 2-isopropylmalate synthase [Rhodopseudomonas palustris CGA009]